MALKRVSAILVLALMLVFCLGFLGQTATAQPEDKDYMSKKGIGGLFQGKLGGDPRAPSPTQKWIGIGSLVVMVIVVKYL